MNVKSAEKSIRNAYILLIFSALMTLVRTGTYIVNGLFTALIGQIICFFIVCGLAYGVYRKNKICAIIALVFYILQDLSKLINMNKSISLGVIIIFIIFIYLLTMGVVGTFAYSRMKEKNEVL